MSPTARSLEKLRADGYHCEIVEHYNSFTRQRYDLWGICDILAIKGDEIVAVQTTSASNASARVKKIAASPIVPIVRGANIRIVVHGWGKYVIGKFKNGHNKFGWRCREIDCS